MHYSVYADEYWQFFNPLHDDEAVTMDTPQHARAAGTGPPAWPLDAFCGRYRRSCGSVAAREAGAERAAARRRGGL
jgi:hypothetical protein